VAREDVILVPRRGMRLDLALGEIGEGIANLPLLVGQVEIPR
jgi:hypothetical protein